MPSLRGDNSPDRLAVERPSKVALLEAVDDLHRTPMLRSFHEFYNSSLQHDIDKVQPFQFLDGYPRDETRMGVLLRIGGVKAFLIFYVYHRARAEDFADEIATSIGPMGRDAADRRVWLPIRIRRHADADDGPALSQIKRQLSELGRLNLRDTVLRQQPMDHLGVLDGHKEPKDTQHAGGHADAYVVHREGAGQAVLVGAPNAGKSSLMHALTQAQTRVGEYPFTTQLPQPAMMPFEDIDAFVAAVLPEAHDHMRTFMSQTSPLAFAG